MGTAEKEKEIYKEYCDTLQTLTFNSKPLIDVLTDVAGENKNYARVIVQCIEDQLEKVSVNLKLPILYLIDSIIKHPLIGPSYTRLFCVKLIPNFIRVYKEGKDEVRTKLSKLRFTWNGVLPNEVLEILDNEIRKINPSWLTAPPVHINPKFIPRTAAAPVTTTNFTVTAIPATELALQQKQKELQALKQRKLELEKELKMLRPKQSVAKMPEKSASVTVTKTTVIATTTTTTTTTTTVVLSVPVTPTTTMIAGRSTPFSSRTYKANNAAVNNPYVYTKPATNGTSTALTVAASTSTTVPTFRIAPVSSQLINAAVTRRVRDPRLRKIVQQEETSTSNKVTITSASSTTAAAAAVTTTATSTVSSLAITKQTSKTVAKESKSALSAVQIDSKVDKQNVLFADTARKESPIAEKFNNRSVVSSSIDAANSKNDSKLSPFKKISNSSKVLPSMSFKKIEPPPAPKINFAGVSNVKYNDSSRHATVADGKSRFRKKESTSKSDTKSKIKVKVETVKKNSKTSKINDLFESSSSSSSKSNSHSATKSKRGNSNSNSSGDRSVKITKSKLKVMAERLAGVDDEKKKNFIDEWSKVCPKLMDKFVKLMETGNKSKKNTNTTGTSTPARITVDITNTNDTNDNNDKNDGDLILIDESKTDPMRRKTVTATATRTSTPTGTNCKNDNSYVDMDIDTDTDMDMDIDVRTDTDYGTTISMIGANATANKFAYMPTSISSGIAENTLPPVVSDSNDQRDEIGTERKDKEDRLRMEMLKLEKKQRSLEANIEKHAAEIKERSSLSEQLEAVMNATSNKIPSETLPQDIDIRTLIPAVVNEMISASATTSTVESVSSFGNPFGLAQPMKDIDYRQLFAFPVPQSQQPPTLSAAVPSSTCQEVSTSTVECKMADLISSSASKVDSSSETVVVSDDDRDQDRDRDLDLIPAFRANEKTAVKRRKQDSADDDNSKHDDNENDGADDNESNLKTKRQRTMSDSGGNDRQSLESFSSQPQSESKFSEKNRYDSSRYSSDSDADNDNNDNDVNMGSDAVAVTKRNRLEEVTASGSQMVTEEMKPCSDMVIMSTSEPRTALESPPPNMFPFFGAPSFVPSSINANFGVISRTKPEVPEANYDVLRMIERDPVKEIDIDSTRREIRHYGSSAVVFLNWDDPRQISFFNGMRKIIIDNKFEIPCSLNRADVESLVYGRPHRFRFGAPTRELYIDGIGYECFFNGPPIQVRFDDVYRSVRLSGRPPRVNIGKRKRVDLVAGKINIIIDEELTFPVFLDAKPQSIVVHGVPFVIMFIDALKRILINDVPFRAEFGGLSQSFKFRNKIYCFRLTGLPIGIVPGAINIFQMVMTKLPSPPPLPPSLQYSALNSNNDDFSLLSPPHSVPSNLPQSMGNVRSVLDNQPAIDIANDAKPQTNILENLNIDELFQKLVASGIVSSSNSNTAPSDRKGGESNGNTAVDTKGADSVDTNETVKFVDFEKPETLKQKQPALVTKLYSGVQCSSCGLRFPFDQTVKYRQHLDWHFRLNRKGKDGARMIHSRKWHYNILDWMKFQEMEDTSDRGQSWFENHPATEYTEQIEEEVRCVAAGENDHNAVCDLCRDRLEQFFNEDIEEWQLRNAIRVEEKLYHPLCYQDYQEKNDHSDVEEIVDSMEPINVDDISAPEENIIAVDDSSVLEKCDDMIEEQQAQVHNDDVELNESVTIKREKPDLPAETTEPATVANNVPHEISEKSNIPEEEYRYTSLEEEDSDVEEVQLIEQPIEQIVINDDGNDLEESNLETLNLEDIIAAQSEEIVTDRNETVSESATGGDQVTNDDDEAKLDEQQSQIVDITHRVPNVVSIDGNVDMGESIPLMNTATKIKINITKNRAESKSPSPPIATTTLSEPKEMEKLVDVDDVATVSAEESPQVFGTSFDGQPLPPGEELTAPEKKQRLKDRKLTEYPPVSKGTETSALCSIL